MDLWSFFHVSEINGATVKDFKSDLICGETSSYLSSFGYIDGWLLPQALCISLLDDGSWNAIGLFYLLSPTVYFSLALTSMPTASLRSWVVVALIFFVGLQS